MIRQPPRIKHTDTLSPHTSLYRTRSCTCKRMMGGRNLVEKVQIGGVGITNQPVVFADVSPCHHLHLDNKPALLLGMNGLQRFDLIAVDFGRKRVHFLLPNGVAAESPIRLASR